MSYTEKSPKILFTCTTYMSKPNKLDSLKQNNEITIQITDTVILNQFKVFDVFTDFLKENGIKKHEINTPLGLNFYWNIANAAGKILHYEVILINTTNAIIIAPENIQKGNILNFHFEGYTQTQTIE